ncbi:helix-turn-helix domain-containing protein [Microbacterium oleivorans]|uniref:helix-turn-helix domain-containing protein n=1 Tax=Microbacterium oleivorans TaxID=273677 RepID=UPI0033D1D518
MSATTPDPDEYLLGDLPRPRRASKIERATRRQEAIALRRAGVGVDAIATRLKVHPSTVYAWMKDAIAAIPREEADELRMLELDRLDAIFRGHFHAAVSGDVRSAETCLKVMERRARLLNLDAARAQGLEQVGGLLDRLVLGDVESTEG